MIELNDQQTAAVQHKDGPILVFAGAGSGKTRVIVSRIAHLIHHHRIPAYKILAVTFTNKAAAEMKARVSRMLGESEAIQLTIGTFHSICARILRIESNHIGLAPSFTIVDDPEQIARVKRAILALNLSTDRVNPRSICEYISRMKNKFISPEAQIESAGFNIQLKWMAQVYAEYENQLKNDQAVDFDDLIVKVVRLFDDNLTICEKYQKKFEYIMIDEYQDTNHAQYRLVSRLAALYRNIMAVGDDDQSIYGWRGAEIENILNFSNDFHDAKIIKLEQNYRSTQTILATASALMSNNAIRAEKTLWTSNPEGEKICVNLVENERAEARMVLSHIRAHAKSKGRKLSEFAIFYRTNSQSRVFEEVFIEARLPYRVIGNIAFFKRKEIKDILSYLRLILNPFDSGACLRILNNPKRGIGESTQDTLEETARSRNTDLFSAIEYTVENSLLPEHKLVKVKAFMELIHCLIRESKETSIADFIELLVARSGYRKQYEDTTNQDALTSIEIIDEFFRMVSDYSDRSSSTLGDFADYLSLNEEKTDQPGQVDTEAEKVTFMTLHNSKGLEFPVVFIAGFEEGLIPLIRADSELKEQDLAEERRLLYVGITRARENLILSATRERRKYASTCPSKISRFLRELPADKIIIENSAAMTPSIGLTSKEVTSGNISKIPSGNLTHPNSEHEFMKGDKVKHSLYGKGTVIQFSGKGVSAKITISFENAGIKKLIVGPARLIRLS